MAHQVDRLVKIGKDGFAILDEIYGKNKKSAGSRVPAATTTTPAYEHYNHGHRPHNFNNQQQQAHRNLKVVTVWEPVMIDSNQPAQFYGGISMVDYSYEETSFRGLYY